MLVSKPVERPRPRVNPKMSYGLWAIMMFQCSLSALTNVPFWWKMLTIGEAGPFGGKTTWKISVSSSSLCLEPKPTLKKYGFQHLF